MAPRTMGKRKNGEIDVSSRDRILAAALAEFADRGFEGTSTSEIARLAGVTQPLVHYHFESKLALWQAAVNSALKDAERFFAGAFDEMEDLDDVDRFALLLRRFIRFTALHPELSRIVLHEGVSGGERLHWMVEGGIVGYGDLFATWYQGMIESGRARPMSYQLVGTALAAAASYPFVVRASMRELHGLDVMDPEVIERHADTVIELFLHGMLVGDPAPAVGVQT